VSIIFIPVETVDAKLRAIAKIAERSTLDKHPLCILVPDEKARQFVDDLLWKFPIESFLPHPTAYLTIETAPKEASALFNLCPTPFLEKNIYKTIYELEDKTSLDRLDLSKKRYESYKQEGYSISYL
jgi:DNA polymerase IIIc chi subunit